MSHLITTMEQLGSNPALKALVRVNCLKVLINLGLNERISTSLITKNINKLPQMRKIRTKMVCYVSIPPGQVFKVQRSNTCSAPSQSINIKNIKIIAA
ncbi:MAG: hypothetical protein HRT52_22590 [Colwellia sp.]|nr:hypothetical protein [Colwellia sp.]